MKPKGTTILLMPLFSYKAASVVVYKCVNREQNLDVFQQMCLADHAFERKLTTDAKLTGALQLAMVDAEFAGAPDRTVGGSDAMTCIREALNRRVRFSTIQMYELAVVYDDIDPNENLERIVSEVRQEMVYVSGLLSRFKGMAAEKRSVDSWLEFDVSNISCRRHYQNLSDMADTVDGPVLIEDTPHTYDEKS